MGSISEFKLSLCDDLGRLFDTVEKNIFISASSNESVVSVHMAEGKPSLQLTGRGPGEAVISVATRDYTSSPEVYFKAK